MPSTKRHVFLLQIESKKAAAKNLESSLEEAKGRLAAQLEEQGRLEDKMRSLSVEVTTQHAQVEKLHHDVSRPRTGRALSR